jgi:hypothetical protein
MSQMHGGSVCGGDVWPLSWLRDEEESMASPTYAVVAVLFALGVALSMGFLLWLIDADLFAGSSGGAEAAQHAILPLIYLAGPCAVWSATSSLSSSGSSSACAGEFD